MEVLLLGPLLVLIRSDFRERQVGVPALLAFGGIQWGICIAESGTAVFAERVLENFLLLAVWGVGTGIWFRWLRPGRKGVRTGWIGISLIYWLISGKNHSATIPLVSMIGICYLPVLFFRMYGY